MVSVLSPFVELLYRRQHLRLLLLHQVQFIFMLSTEFLEELDFASSICPQSSLSVTTLKSGDLWQLELLYAVQELELLFWRLSQSL